VRVHVALVGLAGVLGLAAGIGLGRWVFAADGRAPPAVVPVQGPPKPGSVATRSVSADDSIQAATPGDGPSSDGGGASSSWPRVHEALLEAKVRQLEAELRRREGEVDQTGGRPLREPPNLQDRFTETALVQPMNSGLPSVAPAAAGVTSVDCSEYPCIVYASALDVDLAKQLKDAPALQAYFQEHDHGTIGLTGDGPNDLLYFYVMPVDDPNEDDDVSKRISSRIIDMGIANGTGILTGRKGAR
jgi:hypothetical protein